MNNHDDYHWSPEPTNRFDWPETRSYAQSKPIENPPKQRSSGLRRTLIATAAAGALLLGTIDACNRAADREQERYNRILTLEHNLETSTKHRVEFKTYSFDAPLHRLFGEYTDDERVALIMNLCYQNSMDCQGVPANPSDVDISQVATPVVRDDKLYTIGDLNEARAILWK